jgi:GAF domain-containing protein
MALRAMITALGQELGACVGLIYGLKRDGRFHLVESFGLDRQTVKALEGLDPRDFISPADVSAGLVSVRSDLKPLLEAPPPAWVGPQAKLSSAFSIPVTRSGLLVGCLLVGFFQDQRDNPFGGAVAHAAAFATFHLLSEEPSLVLGSP